jgi:hypothetical protein
MKVTKHSLPFFLALLVGYLTGAMLSGSANAQSSSDQTIRVKRRRAGDVAERIQEESQAHGML